MFERADLLGVSVCKVTAAEVIDKILEYLKTDEGHIIVTADASAVVIAMDDPEFTEIIREADIVTPDGAGILLASKILGLGITEKVSGVDLARSLCRLSGEKGFSIYFLGAAPGVAEEARQKLLEQYPDMKVVGVHHGYFKPEEEASIVEEVKASGADILLVAMGIPAQEKLIKRNLDKLGVKAAIGVGGTFDVFSGRIERAPVWMQRHGMEWLHRLCKNPKKISKVAMLPKFMMKVLRKRLLGG
ncbi:MAG: WecB/TagA/CpsF family glycosyltransferase [Abditibacteriota bacterium]|nr:WecB/TagA/CpsF family glycosyltransferase [Abditibacteriota bacterium]MBP5094164.1 WecB/TagA/CpsF family glycosyltransferase [Abditibacteriota bacterium]MBP5717488.1 WecB/TagA/CpsF family glycosyltransferase [Abditibacteriota bacterium]